MGIALTQKQIALDLKRRSVESESGCWNWTGAFYKVGYPVVPKTYGGGRYGHRAMFAAAVCQIPSGMYVLHSCDNRKCVNPAHLFLGTHIDNIKDMNSKNRQRGGSLPNELNPSCKFTNEKIETIRRFHSYGLAKREIEKSFGISESHYYRIIRGETRKGV